MGLIENMRDAVEMAGGRMTREDYLTAVQRLIEDEGGSTKIDSLKSNAFNRNRMNKAGITTLDVGSEQFVWTQTMADDFLSGNMTSVGPMAVTTGNITTQTPDNMTDDGCFFGIRRRTADDFSEAARHYIIPRGTLRYVESEKNEMRLFSLAFKKGMNILLDGPKGCGKTMGLKAWASEVGLPVYRVNCSEGFTEESFIGYNTLIEGKVVWIDGLLPTAMRNGGILIFDEFRNARASVMSAWNAVGDSGTLLIPENNNEVIVAHPDFRTAATMNPLDGYAGGQDLNQATLDRFGMSMKVDYLPTDREMTVICEQSGVANLALARQFCTFAGDLRRMKVEGTLETDTSTRMLVDMMDASTDLNVAEIIDYIVVGRYQPHEVEDVKAVARARMADY